MISFIIEAEWGLTVMLSPSLCLLSVLKLMPENPANLARRDIFVINFSNPRQSIVDLDFVVNTHSMILTHAMLTKRAPASILLPLVMPKSQHYRELKLKLIHSSEDSIVIELPSCSSLVNRWQSQAIQVEYEIVIQHYLLSLQTTSRLSIVFGGLSQCMGGK